MGQEAERRRTLSCDGAGGQDGQQALSLQVEEMLLLHLEELLLDGDLLRCQLSHREKKRITKRQDVILNHGMYQHN